MSRYRRAQQRSATAAVWTASNPLLLIGEIGWETDTQKAKMGDGVNRWNSLSYITALGTGGGGISDGDKGDITVSGSGATWTIDNDVVTNAKLANVATATIKGRTTAGTGDPEDLSASQTRTLLNVVEKPIQVTGITLSSGSWSLVSGLYEYSLSNANITASSIVEVIPDNADIATVKAAEILPRTDSSAGAVKLYATNAPTGNIGVTINIFFI